MKKKDADNATENELVHEHLAHLHEHGENCGHIAVQHGDHLDYQHDGHLHRVHGKQVYECGRPLKH